jgi:hypothetical protein
VISLETHVGITSQRHELANTDPRIYRSWNQVPRRSKHPLSTGHTRREPSCMIMNAELQSKYWYEKCQTTYGSMKDCNYGLDQCYSRRTCETLT